MLRRKFKHRIKQIATTINTTITTHANKNNNLNYQSMVKTYEHISYIFNLQTNKFDILFVILN